ncbi:hypothetical protein G6F70_005271 [Rhizopus microsporus]|uniref:Velvet domain-containing protein n=2 Tax=Rhizopus TaxID=4842 RepID=A0A1X0RQ08_RHIZD|nr:hypothetical protein G6F70_005271 [Rhizopus microsporus]KAG1212291.1 hypothetical protein G6F69_003817 [Rhizopus microsporus]KAG1234015.1 hypothetical protein G6F67_003863 [Rhizopus microsporus]ORE13988.1 hypothetical protein BCV71DRAFT_267847 [Rhizopus microsporus]
MNTVIPPLKLSRPSQSFKKYKLQIVQNPIRARCCGFGEKDKRPIDPPPILKLTAEDESGKPLELKAGDAVLFLVHCQLYNENGTLDKTLVHTPWSNTSPIRKQTIRYSAHKDKPEYVRNLIGSVVSNAYHLYDENSIPGIFFIFQDLSVRIEGTYTLKFVFINLAEGDPLTMSTKVQVEMVSKPFTVYSAKKFPGMTESTTLSRCFAKQGIKIPIRSEHVSMKTPQKNAAPELPTPTLPTPALPTPALATPSSSTSSSTTISKLSIKNILLPEDNDNGT